MKKKEPSKKITLHRETLQQLAGGGNVRVASTVSDDSMCDPPHCPLTALIC
ncbi:MAG TPA: hypothetical protein VKY89_22365 [Thermoanaerobaculia bacterium]|nr:hypothetical protein [Thermoanaerobaculia bacterium]